MSHPLRALMLLVLLTLAAEAVDPRMATVGSAWADDDDDGDDDDNDDGDDDSSGGGAGNDGARGGGNNEMPRFLRRIFRQEEPRRVVRAAPPVQPAPAYRPEIVVLNLLSADLAVLIAEGFTLIEEQALTDLGATMRRLRAPADMTLEVARDRVRALGSGQDADYNHYYRTEESRCEGPHCATADQIGWSMAANRDACGPEVVIGMVDTGLNPDHETFADARLEVHRIDGTDTPSREMHGTSVAALLVGAPDGRSPGLVPDMRLVAVDAFHHTGGDERADAFTLIRALSHLAGAGAQVINLSLAGPPNTVLEQAVTRLVSESGIVIVAAAGNGGPRADPAYPAGYDGVIAVTAVDRRGQVYRRAGRGPHLDLAAPGVEVWTAASISGGRPKTGTSYAAPFVTAAAARLVQAQPSVTPHQIAEQLAATATDLGDPGRDDAYGHGLVTAGPCVGTLHDQP